MRLTLGFPSRGEQPLRGDGGPVADINHGLNSEQLMVLQQQCRRQHCSSVDWLHPDLVGRAGDGHGLSPRASRPCYQQPRDGQGRSYVSIDDVRRSSLPFEHRLDSGSPPQRAPH